MENIRLQQLGLTCLGTLVFPWFLLSKSTRFLTGPIQCSITSRFANTRESLAKIGSLLTFYRWLLLNDLFCCNHRQITRDWVSRLEIGRYARAYAKVGPRNRFGIRGLKGRHASICPFFVHDGGRGNLFYPAKARWNATVRSEERGSITF